MRGFIFPTPVESHATAMKAIGEVWFDKRVKAGLHAFDGRADLSPSGHGRTFGKLEHPLIGEQYNAVKPGGNRFGITPLLDMLQLDLATLGQRLPRDLQIRLRGEHEYEKVAYELHIAAGFRRLGGEINWIADNTHRQAELTATWGGAGPIAVECKKRDHRGGAEAAGDQFWKHYQDEMRIRLEDEGLNYWVKLTGREFRLADVRTVVDGAVEAMKSAERGHSDLLDGRYAVDFERLCEPGGSVSNDVLRLFPRGVLGVNMGSISPDQLRYPEEAGDPMASGDIKDPRLIRMEITEDPDQVISTVLSNLKTAAKQVKGRLPGIVYVDCNSRFYHRQEEVFDDIAAAVRKRLEHQHEGVSVVVLTDIYPGYSMDNVLGWNLRTENIVNPRATHRLSKDFRYPGDDRGVWLPGRLGVDPAAPGPRLYLPARLLDRSA